MPTEILLPQWGMEMDEGTVVKWLKKEGDYVQEGEPLVEIETAKLTTELESFASGVLARIVVPEGSTVRIRTVLAVIAAPGEEIPSIDADVANAVHPAGAVPSTQSSAGTTAQPSAASSQAAPSQGAPQGNVQVVPAARRLAQQHGIDLSQIKGNGPRGRILIADVEKALEALSGPSPPALVAKSAANVQVVPAARRLARENGVDLSQVQGSGPGGRILAADVEKAIEGASEGRDQGAVQGQTLPLEGIRRTIATRMLQSLQTMAQVTLTTEANVSQAMLLREGLSRHSNSGGLSPLHLVVKATARGLRDHPRLNAVQTEDQVQLMDQVNIGLAVSLPEGLMTPVIREVDGKSLNQIAQEARELAAKIRENRATPDDVTGGGFTVTNLGTYDIDGFTPIINPPQVGILGVGRAVDKPVIENGEVAKATMMFLSLTFDHRVVDGAPAAEFLQTVKGYLEDPWWMVS